MVLVVSADIKLGLLDQVNEGENETQAGEVASQAKLFRNQVALTLQGIKGDSVELTLGSQLKVSEVSQANNPSLQWQVDGNRLILSTVSAEEGTAHFVLTGSIESKPADTEGMLAVEGPSFSYWWAKVEPSGSNNFVPQPEGQDFNLMKVQVSFDLPEDHLGTSVEAEFPIKPHHLGVGVLKGYESVESSTSPIRVLYPTGMESIASKFLALAEQAKEAVDRMVPMGERPQKPYTIVLAPYFKYIAFEYPGLVLIDPIRNPTITPNQTLNTLELLIHEYFHLYVGGIMPENSFRDLPITEGLAQLHQMRGIGKLLGNEHVRNAQVMTGNYTLLKDEAPPICNEIPYEDKPYQLHYINAAGVWNALADLYPSASAWEKALAKTIERHAHQLTSTEEVYEDLIEELPLDVNQKNLLKKGFKSWFCEGGLPSCTVEVTRDGNLIRIRAQQKSGVKRMVILGGKVLTSSGAALEVDPTNLQGALIINGQIVMTEETATWEIAIPKNEAFGSYSIGRNSLLPMEWSLKQSPEALGHLIGNDDDAVVRMRAIKELVITSRKDSQVKSIIAQAMKQAFKRNTPPLLLYLFLAEILKGSDQLIETVAIEIKEELQERLRKPFQNAWEENGSAAEVSHAEILKENGHTYLLWGDPTYAVALKATLKDTTKSIEERTLAFIGLSKSNNPTDAKDALDEFLELAKAMPAGPERDVTWNRIATGISVLRLPWRELKPYFEMAKQSTLWHPKNMQAYLQLYASFLLNNPACRNPEALSYMREIVETLKGNPDTKEWGGYIEVHFPSS